MERKHERVFEDGELSFPANGFRKLRSSSATGNRPYFPGALFVVAALCSVSIPAAAAQNSSPQIPVEVAIQGRVLNSAGTPVDDASVRLEREDVSVRRETKTNAAGVFALSAPGTGKYLLSAEKAGLSSRTTSLVVSSLGEQKQIELVLEDSSVVHADSKASAPPSTQAMEFADKPDFTVAGVMDWTAAGGH